MPADYLSYLDFQGVWRKLSLIWCFFLIFFMYALQELRQYLSNLADQCNSENNAVDMPLVIILDNLHHVSSLGEIFNGLLNCKYHKW